MDGRSSLFVAVFIENRKNDKKTKAGLSQVPQPYHNI